MADVDKLWTDPYANYPVKYTEQVKDKKTMENVFADYRLARQNSKV